MPERETIERASQDRKEGKSPSTQAGEFVREEIHHVREGKHGARSPQQAIAIGLSKARRAGVKLPAPKAGKVSSRTRSQAKRDLMKGQRQDEKTPSATRSRAVSRTLKREGGATVSRKSLSTQARRSAQQRGSTSRHRAALKAVQTKGKSRLQQAARRAAQTRKKAA
jgi:hypothetical protein